jgi:hypothetical protein
LRPARQLILDVREGASGSGDATATVATLAGQAAHAVAARSQQWHAIPDAEAVDRLCVSLRENALSLAILYFAEWVDRWLMGDDVPGP